LISPHSSLEDLIKVFSKVISKERYDETLSNTFKIALRQIKVPIPQSKILQKEYRKRELAIPFFFWSVFILTRYIIVITIW